MENNEKRQVYSSIKMTVNIIICIIVILLVMLLQFFVLDNWQQEVHTGLEYWFQKFLSGLATFMVMITMANTTEEKLKKTNKEYNSKLDAIQSNYDEVHSHYWIDDLEVFILNLNRNNKYEVYIENAKRQLRIANKLYAKNPERRKKRVEPLEKMLTKTVDEVWEEEFVKYHKVTIDQLFSGAFDTKSNDDGNDLQVHKGRYSVEKLGWKIITIVTLGVVTTDFSFYFTNFEISMIPSLIFKVLAILWSMYSGLTFGYFMIDRYKVVLKKKLKILTQFRSREIADTKSFDVKPKVDILVDKMVNKYGCNATERNLTQVSEDAKEVVEKEKTTKENPLQKTWSESFGSGTPIAPQKFAKNLIENIVENDAQKNIEKLN